MKVLFVNFTDIYGGAEVFLKNILNYPQKDIKKILLTPKSEKLEEGLGEDVEVIYGLNRAPRFMSLTNFTSMIKQALLINKLIDTRGIDVVFLNGRNSYYLAKFISEKVKKIGMWHGSELRSAYHRKLLTKTSYDSLDKIILVSHNQMKKIHGVFKDKYDSKIKIVHLGINEKKFSSENHTRKNSDKIKLLTVARLEQLKGHSYLIDAMDILCNKYDNVTLTLVGEGDQETFIKDKIESYNLQNKVSLVGFSDPVQYYRNSDIFILPSYTEAFPLVNLEAMACGVPVVSSDVGGVSEAITHGENGFLYKAGDIDSLVHHLSTLIESKSIREQMSKNAVNRVTNEFTLDRMNNDIYKIIKD